CSVNQFFLKKRFFRIYPLYWIALVLFFIFFDIYWGMNVIYLIAHFFGLQIIVAPLFSPPIWTLWFIGIIVIYYLIFILLSYLESIKRIIPASLVVLAFFLILHFNFNLVEYRFFVYYPPFILGIIIAEVYRSPYFSTIKEKITNIHYLIPFITVICSVIIGWILYTRLAWFTYITYRRTYRTQFLALIVEQELTVFEFIANILLTDCVIVAFIVFILSIFNLSIRVFTLIIDKMSFERAIFLVSYSTYAVYLFHRPFLIIFNAIMLTVFNIDMLEKSNFYLTLISIPLLFTLAFLIQNLADKGIPFLYEKLSNKIPTTNL
ncbi:MAG: acyltransferase family protein, partial [Promethearchaeota archaeon]